MWYCSVEGIYYVRIVVKQCFKSIPCLTKSNLCIANRIKHTHQQAENSSKIVFTNGKCINLFWHFTLRDWYRCTPKEPYSIQWTWKSHM